jgi:hypothetical protein
MPALSMLSLLGYVAVTGRPAPGMLADEVYPLPWPMRRLLDE